MFVNNVKLFLVQLFDEIFILVIGCLAGFEFSWLTGKFDCQNGGFCVNSSGMGICNCQTGFSGTYCEASCEENKTVIFI